MKIGLFVGLFVVFFVGLFVGLCVGLCVGLLVGLGVVFAVVKFLTGGKNLLLFLFLLLPLPKMSCNVGLFDVFLFRFGIRVVAGVVLLVVLTVVFVVVLTKGDGLGPKSFEMTLLNPSLTHRPGYCTEHDVPDGHLEQARPCSYICPPM